MTLYNLKEADQTQTKTLLEANSVEIKKTTNNTFVISCPSCQEPEAYIYHNIGSSKYITCNRKNKCTSEPLKLWDHIANNKGIDPNNNFEMLKYINEILGLEFNQANIDQYNKLKEEKDQKQEFFIKCNQIFINALRDVSNKQVQFSLNYLKQTRNYTDEHIKAFKLGFFPNYQDLVDKLVKDYNYDKKAADEMILKHFGNIIDTNGKATSEEHAQRITLTYYNTQNEISGFIIRKPAEVDSKEKKYQFNKGLLKGDYLFNLNTLNFRDKLNKSLVIVEGQLDALAASHMSSQEVTDSYHFVASGGSAISDKQAQLLKNQQFTQVTFFIDNDKAGEDFAKSVAKLREHDITAFVASVPEIYQKEIKDIDQLLREYPDVDLYSILENKRPAIEAELDIIKKSHSEDQNNIKPSEEHKILEECKAKFEGKLLTFENKYYKEYMKSNFNIDEAVLTSQVPKLESSKGSGGSENKKEEHPLIVGLREEIAQVISKSADADEPHPLDMHEYRQKVHVIQKALLKENIIRDTKNDPDIKKSNNILAGIKKYNDLLNVNYEEDKPYTSETLLEKVLKNPEGLKTGFSVLDKYVTIQPSSLVFIAGKPSHGKTTMMLNMLRNMIKAYPKKSFLFYSYEETVEQIWLKILLINIELSGDFKARDGRSYLDEIIYQVKKYKMSSVTIEDRDIKTFDNSLGKSFKEVKSWIDEGRLQLLDRKPNVEVLTSAIIERVQTSTRLCKPTGGVFIDYVQKLTTEEQKPNRQQELQVICENLLLNCIDKRVNTAIILGAQVNREVKSLDTLTLGNMREAADIEHVANLVLGVWDDRAAKLDNLRSVIEKIEEKIIGKKAEGKNDEVKNLQNNIGNIKQEIIDVENEKDATKQIKILKNRNGTKDNTIDLDCKSARFLLKDYC